MMMNISPAHGVVLPLVCVELGWPSCTDCSFDLSLRHSLFLPRSQVDVTCVLVRACEACRDYLGSV